MEKFSYTIKDPIGLHARPAGIIVRKAAAFQSDISIKHNGKTADAKRLFSIMGLGVKSGDTIQIEIDGKDEAEAAELFKRFLQSTV